jgi:hypothetical protein
MENELGVFVWAFIIGCAGIVLFRMLPHILGSLVDLFEWFDSRDKATKLPSHIVDRLARQQPRR